MSAFYECILKAGDCDNVVIDRHSIAVAMGGEVTEQDRKYLVNKQIYDIFADSYKSASKAVGIPATELQAITWIYQRRTE